LFIEKVVLNVFINNKIASPQTIENKNRASISSEDALPGLSVRVYYDLPIVDLFFLQ